MKAIASHFLKGHLAIRNSESLLKKNTKFTYRMINT